MVRYIDHHRVNPIERLKGKGRFETTKVGKQIHFIIHEFFDRGIEQKICDGVYFYLPSKNMGIKKDDYKKVKFENPIDLNAHYTSEHGNVYDKKSQKIIDGFLKKGWSVSIEGRGENAKITSIEKGINQKNISFISNKWKKYGEKTKAEIGFLASVYEYGSIDLKWSKKDRNGSEIII